jgi:hypothetical protein
MTYFSTTYRGYTITYTGGLYRIAGMPSLGYTTMEGAQKCIDKVISERNDKH